MKHKLEKILVFKEFTVWQKKHKHQQCDEGFQKSTELFISKREFEPRKGHLNEYI